MHAPLSFLGTRAAVLSSALLLVAATSALGVACSVSPEGSQSIVAALSSGSGALLGLAGKCLDANGGSSANGTVVQLWDCNGTVAQQWTLSGGQLLGPGGKCLDATGESSANGTRLQLWDCWGGPNQQWSFATANEIVGIGGKCVDVLGAHDTEGTPVQLWDCWGGANQQWTWNGGAGGSTGGSDLDAPVDAEGSVPAPVDAGSAPITQCSSGSFPSGQACVAGTPDVVVDWSHVLQSIDPLAYGVDSPSSGNPAISTQPGFLDALHQVTQGKGLVRIHGWGMIDPSSPDTWVTGNQTWDEGKVVAALTPLTTAGYPVLIDIPAGPGGDGDDDPDTFAAFAAALVKIVNVDHHLGVKYWEVPNEQEAKGVTAAQMTVLLTKAFAAMRAVDPTILVGGPATQWPDSGYIHDVVQGLIAGGVTIDFVSTHFYPGDGTQSDEDSFAAALSIEGLMQQMRTVVDALSPDRKIRVFLDEYAIGWSFAPSEYTNRAAVFNAIVQGSVVNGGGTASAIWSGVAPEHDMSIVDPSFALRDPAHVFAVLNQFGQGQSVATTGPAAVYTYATVDPTTGAHTVVLANQGTAAAKLTIETDGWSPRMATRYQVTAAGYAASAQADWSTVVSGGVDVDGESVVMLVAE